MPGCQVRVGSLVHRPGSLPTTNELSRRSLSGPPRTRSEPGKRGEKPENTPNAEVTSQLAVPSEAITDDFRIVIEAWPTLFDDTKTELMSRFTRASAWGTTRNAPPHNHREPLHNHHA